MIMIMIEILTLLVLCHFIGDYVFQTDAIAVGKNRNVNPAHLGVPWVYWMTAHASTHAVLVYVVVKLFDFNPVYAIVFALTEFATHFMIDFMKCEKEIDIHQDQGFHLACKAGYCCLLLV